MSTEVSTNVTQQVRPITEWRRGFSEGKNIRGENEARTRFINNDSNTVWEVSATKGCSGGIVATARRGKIEGSCLSFTRFITVAKSSARATTKAVRETMNSGVENFLAHFTEYEARNDESSVFTQFSTGTSIPTV